LAVAVELRGRPRIDLSSLPSLLLLVNFVWRYPTVFFEQHASFCVKMEFDGRRWVEILLFFYGTGANGKSTFLNIISKAVGDHAQRAALDLLLAKKGDSHPTELADLFRARLVTSVVEVEHGWRFAE